MPSLLLILFLLFSCSAAQDQLSSSEEKSLRDGKISLIVSIYFLTLGAELLPWFLQRLHGAITIMGVGACFSAGVILGGGFIHILPDAEGTWREYFAVAGPVGLRDPNDVDYPFAPLIAIFTLLILCTIDGILVRGGLEGGDGHSHGGKSGHNHAVPQLPQISQPPEATEARAQIALTDFTTGERDVESLEKLPGHSLADDLQRHRGSREQINQAYIFFAALSIHSIFDGLSIGSEASMSGFYSLLAAVLGHKALDGFALGIPVYFAKLPFWHTFFALNFCALMTPLGIGIGWSSQAGNSTTSSLLARAVVLSISGGSFIFISLIELLPAGIQDGKYLPLKYFVTFIGFGAMALIGIWV